MSLELYYDANQSRTSILLCPAVIVIGAIIATWEASSVLGLVVGIVFVSFGVVGFAIAWQRRNDRSVALSINRDGILDRRLGLRTIRWDQILAIEAKETDGQHPIRYLDLYIRKTMPARLSWQIVLWRLVGSRGVPISDEGLDGNFNQILLATVECANQKKVPYRV